MTTALYLVRMPIALAAILLLFLSCMQSVSDQDPTPTVEPHDPAGTATRDAAQTSVAQLRGTIQADLTRTAKVPPTKTPLSQADQIATRDASARQTEMFETGYRDFKTEEARQKAAQIDKDITSDVATMDAEHDATKAITEQWLLNDHYAEQTRSAGGECDPSYPLVCIFPLSAVGDLDCSDIPYRGFTVRDPDPHFFDGDFDGVGCE